MACRHLPGATWQCGSQAKCTTVADESAAHVEELLQHLTTLPAASWPSVIAVDADGPLFVIQLLRLCPYLQHATSGSCCYASRHDLGVPNVHQMRPHVTTCCLLNQMSATERPKLAGRRAHAAQRSVLRAQHSTLSRPSCCAKTAKRHPHYFIQHQPCEALERRCS